jgi:hypothetical protein
VCRGYPPLSEVGLYKKLAAPCFFGYLRFSVIALCGFEA